MYHRIIWGVGMEDLWKWILDNFGSLATLFGAGSVLAIIAGYFFGKKNKIGSVKTAGEDSGIEVTQGEDNNEIGDLETKGHRSPVNISQGK